METTLKRIFKNTIDSLTPGERAVFVRLLLVDVVISLFDIVFLAALLWIVQLYIQPNTAFTASFIPHRLIGNRPVYIIIIFVLLFAAKNIFAYLATTAASRFTASVAVRISANNLLRYQQGSFENFIETDSSSLIRKIGFQPFEFTQYVLVGIQQVVTQLALVIVTITAIIIFNAKLFLLLLLILVPPAILLFYFIRKRLALAKSRIQWSNEHSFQYLLDALKGYVEANIYQKTDFFSRRFVHARQAFSTHLFESLALQTLPARLIEVFAVLGLCVLVILSRWQGTPDETALLTIGAFMAAAYKLIPGLVKLINVIGQVKAHELSVNELEIPAGRSVISNGAAPITSLELQSINFGYAQPLLTDFSLSVASGDFVGISGVSGKGKTSIFNIILGFLPAHSGKVIINNAVVPFAEIKNYWPSVSYVRQQNFFIHDTLLKNITLQDEAADHDRLAEALRVSGLDSLIATFPEGLEKMINENGKNISGGQQQRIAIARAVYKNADLLLLDEPFNELDETSARQMLACFRDYAATGKIILLISHDKHSFSFCNKTVSLDE